MAPSYGMTNTTPIVTPSMIQAFRDAWTEADAKGLSGERVRAGLEAALAVPAEPPLRVPPLEGQTLRIVPYLDETDSSSVPDGTDRTESHPTTDLTKAQTITSEVAATANFPDHLRAHKLVIDLDVPATLVPSTTEGHSHLYIDHAMGWTAYKDLLRALERVGIIEPGYLGASVKRGFTAVRLPWVRKPVAKDTPTTANPWA